MLRYAALIALSASLVNAAAPPPEQIAFIEAKIRPVLVKACFNCHSGDAEKLKAGLYLDSREAMLKGGDSGPAVVPGKPDDSLLIKAISYHEIDLEMPPKRKLADHVIVDFRRWVEMGVPWPVAKVQRVETLPETNWDWAKLKAGHWSFQPIARSKPPTVERDDWVRNEIDRFILARLEAENLKPAPPAEKRTLRTTCACFDLTGLPPTPEQVRRFLDKDSPHAYATLVDELLASPHYGERWGRHWLDVARYSDGDNRLLWRMSPRRLEVESWRDSLLAVTGELDRGIGGSPFDNMLGSNRRTLYALISRNADRSESDAILRLFDFPAPRTTIATRAVSTVPQHYELLYARPPLAMEIEVGLAYLSESGDGPSALQQYAQVLLSAHEFWQID